MNRELQLREVQFLAIVEYFDDDESTAEFVKFGAMSGDAFKENLRAVIRAKFRIDIFGGVFDVFYLDEKTEVKLNLMGDVSDFLLWIGCFFDDQLLHLTFKLRLVVRKKRAFRRASQQGLTIQQASAPPISVPTLLPTSSVSETRPVENKKQEEVKSKPLISNSPLFNPPSRESKNAASEKSSNDSDDDMEITLQPVEPKKTGLSIKKKTDTDESKLILIKNELKQVEELENVDLPDDLLEMINAATNGDMERVNAIRQFLDLEDGPASFFKTQANLSALLETFQKCEWDLDRVMEE